MDGIHPTFRQVPPRVPRDSTHAVFSPSCDALIAATYPPGPSSSRSINCYHDCINNIVIPPPTITTSYLFFLALDDENALILIPIILLLLLLLLLEPTRGFDDCPILIIILLNI